MRLFPPSKIPNTTMSISSVRVIFSFTFSQAIDCLVSSARNFIRPMLRFVHIMELHILQSFVLALADPAGQLCQILSLDILEDFSENVLECWVDTGQVHLMCSGQYYHSCIADQKLCGSRLKHNAHDGPSSCHNSYQGFFFDCMTMLRPIHGL